MPPRRQAVDLPSVRFVGGGYHGVQAPGKLVERKGRYRALRKWPYAEGDTERTPRYDLYEWDAATGAFRYIGTVFGFDGEAGVRLDKAITKWAKEHPIAPPRRWAWDT
jgi:hypothetical protein